MFIDPTGMIWEKPEDKTRLQNDIKNKIKSHEAEISTLTESLVGEKRSKKINGINDKINDFNNKIDLLNKSLNDIELLDKDIRTYSLEILPENAKNAFVYVKNTTFYIQGSNTGDFLHEIRHIGQSLEKGRDFLFTFKGGFNRLKNPGRTLEEATFNEVEAYKIQAAYDGIESLNLQNASYINDIDSFKINKSRKTSDFKPLYPFMDKYLNQTKK